MPKLLVLALVLTSCVSAGRMPDAASAWRAGSYGRAIALAQSEYERFRDGNDLTEATVTSDLATLVDVLRSPIVLPGDDHASPTPVADDTPTDGDGLARGNMADALRRDLGSSGVLRVVRAVRSVMRLEVERHGRELLAILWRRDPFTEDHTAVADLGPARRSMLVKRAALDALIELARLAKTSR